MNTVITTGQGTYEVNNSDGVHIATAHFSRYRVKGNVRTVGGLRDLRDGNYQDLSSFAYAKDFKNWLTHAFV